MEERLISLLSRESEEELRLLSGGELDRRIYTAEGEFVISDDRIREGRGSISVRTHTRYADFPRHRHNYLEMMIVLEGRITHYIEGEELTLGRGDILFLNKHISHSIRRAERGDIGVNIIISDEFLAAVAPELSATVFAPLFRENAREGGAPMYLHFSTGEDKRYANLTENLLFELTGESPDRNIMERTVSLLLFALAARPELCLGGSQPRTPEERRVLKILSYVKNNFRTASLGELGGLLYLSVPYLSRFIREHTGRSFKELVVEARMERARELIFDTDMPIGEIIRAVGYENESYFHREFRARFGVTPLAMRRTGRQKDDDKNG